MRLPTPASASSRRKRKQNIITFPRKKLVSFGLFLGEIWFHYCEFEVLSYCHGKLRELSQSVCEHTLGERGSIRRDQPVLQKLWEGEPVVVIGTRFLL